MPAIADPIPASPMIPLFPPAWAEVFGEDDFGIFAECSVKGIVFLWRWICPGRFLMGSPKGEPGRWDDEGPQHEVTISRGYWMGETPVTQAQWRAVTGESPRRFKVDDHPVEQVNWHESAAFAGQLNQLIPGLGAALPTEAQWEYACRAGTEGAYNDGSPCTQPEGKDQALDRLGWFNKNSDGGTKPVKAKDKFPNAWGLYDCHGNVWEWCRDGWRTYGETPEMDPIGPLSSNTPVVRGGSWFGLARSCRAACRNLFDPEFRWKYLGLRLAAGQPGESGAAEPPGAERPE